MIPSLLRLNMVGPRVICLFNPWTLTGGKESGRLGSLTSLLLRSLFDTQVTINNVVIKYVAPTTVAAFTCQSITASTAADIWRDLYQVMTHDWLWPRTCAYLSIFLVAGLNSGT